MGLLGLSDGSGWVCGSGGPSGFGESGVVLLGLVGLSSLLGLL